jgi:hypothetical protein
MTRYWSGLKLVSPDSREQNLIYLVRRGGKSHAVPLILFPRESEPTKLIKNNCSGRQFFAIEKIYLYLTPGFF